MTNMDLKASSSEGVRINLVISKKLQQSLNKAVAKTGRSKSELIREGILMMLMKYLGDNI